MSKKNKIVLEGSQTVHYSTSFELDDEQLAEFRKRVKQDDNSSLDEMFDPRDIWDADEMDASDVTIKINDVDESYELLGE